MHFLLALLLSSLLAVHGLRKKSLSVSGALAGLAVGLCTFIHPHPVFGCVLVAFYISGSRITKFGREAKFKIEHEYHEAGQRDMWQVICNSGTGTWIALIHLVLVVSGRRCDWDRALCVGYLAFYACCAGDTFASEIGTAYAHDSNLPILVTNWRRKVPHGTNGGVTLIGTIASIAGGSFMGFITYASSHIMSTESIMCANDATWYLSQSLVNLVLLGGLFGLLGSTIDSILGATIQATYQDSKTKKIVKGPGKNVDMVVGYPLFSNDLVNYAASLLTTLLAVVLTVS